MFVAADHQTEDKEKIAFDQQSRMDEEAYYKARNKTHQVVRSSLILAGIWLSLIFAHLVPHFSLSFRIVAVFLLLIGILRHGLRAGVLIFFASLVANSIFPGFFFNLPYVFYFGPYLLLAFAINRVWQSKYSIVLRVIIGTLLVVILALLYTDVLLPENVWQDVKEYYAYLVVLTGSIGTAVYDYLLGLLAVLYQTRLKSHIQQRKK